MTLRIILIIVLQLYSSLANLDDTYMGKANMAPHVLALSATPIPRSLALALYGDVSLTQVQMVCL